MEAVPPVPAAVSSSATPENAGAASAISKEMPKTIESIAGVYASYPCSLLVLFSNGSALYSWVCLVLIAVRTHTY